MQIRYRKETYIKTLDITSALAVYKSINDDQVSIGKLEDSILWKWYSIAYAIINNQIQRDVFVHRARMTDENALSMAVKIASHADSNASFRNKLETGVFKSLRAAYDACPKGKAGKPSMSDDEKIANFYSRMTPAQRKKHLKILQSL